MRPAALIAALVWAGPGLADGDGLEFSIAGTETCLSQIGGAECIGISAALCMTATEGGASTYGMGGCLSKEADYWDARLNAAYQDLMRRARENDGDFNPPQSQAEALRDMQRAWIAYRDARCGYEYSLWQGGTGGGPASVACYMEVTGEQTLYLESGGAGF